MIKDLSGILIPLRQSRGKEEDLIFSFPRPSPPQNPLPA